MQGSRKLVFGRWPGFKHAASHTWKTSGEQMAQAVHASQSRRIGSRRVHLNVCSCPQHGGHCTLGRRLHLIPVNLTQGIASFEALRCTTVLIDTACNCKRGPTFIIARFKCGRRTKTLTLSPILGNKEQIWYKEQSCTSFTRHCRWHTNPLFTCLGPTSVHIKMLVNRGSTWTWTL